MIEKLVHFSKFRRLLPWGCLAIVVTGLGVVLLMSWRGMRTASFHRSWEDLAAAGKPVILTILNETQAAELGLALHRVSDSESPVRIPLEALQEEQCGFFVWVEDFDHKFSYLKTCVELGKKEGHLVQIMSGLFPGDPVVTNGAAKLQDQPRLVRNLRMAICDQSYQPSLYETVVRSVRKHLFQ